MSDGYGYSEFGMGDYGSSSSPAPVVTGVISIDGCRIRVFFSAPMQDDAAFVAASSYTVTATLGAPVTIQAVTANEPADGGYLAADLTTSGTTLGGSYLVTVSDLLSIDGVPVPETGNFGSFLALGQNLSVDVTQTPGRVILSVRDDLDRPVGLLANGDETDPAGYLLVGGDYPIQPTISAVTRSGTDLILDVGQITSLTYEATVGPSEAFAISGSALLDGVEIGAGASVLVGTAIILDKPVSAATYGWFYEDVSGRITASASFAAAFGINAALATAGTEAVLSISDGTLQLDLTLTSTGTIDVDAGAETAQVIFDWQTAPCNISVIRNQQAGLCSVLIDGIPVHSFALGLWTKPATFGPGVALVLQAGVSSSGFEIRTVSAQASETIYTAAWNYVFTLVFGFVGIVALANDRIRTKRGPLVKAWGDWTPAGPNDVEVRVNGVPVSIANVNPYTGEIFPTVPIPMFPAGMATVDVDYHWIANPIFGMAGLNTPGLALNSWSRPNGHTAVTEAGPPGAAFGLGGFGFGAFGPGAPGPELPVSSGVGVQNNLRFPYSVVLGPMHPFEPKRIGHTYIGYQRDYSALINDPTTLLLNKNPHAIADGALTAASVRQTGRFDGRAAPINEGWSLTGIDTGSVQGGGAYLLVDASTGDYPDGTAALYSRALDLALPTIAQGSARFRGLAVSAYDGVFSGLALGAHDGRRLAVIGALLVDGVQHLGILLDGARPDLETSWQIGPVASAHAVSSNTILIPATEFLPGLGFGSVFRIAAGPQAGVYTIDACGIVAQGSDVALTFSPALPSAISLFGANAFTVLFETPWQSDDSIGLRFAVDFPEGTLTAYLSGRLSGLLGAAPVPAYPAETGLLIPAAITGGFFWGSISRRAANRSVWDLAQYSANPVALTQTVSGVFVSDDMTVLPENGADPWFISGGYGASALSLGALVLASTAKSDTLDFTFGYSRVEPHLTPKVTANFLATTQVTTGTLGAGDIALRIRDTSREVSLVNLLYRQTAVSHSLVTDLPSTSFSGLQALELDGWSSSTVTPIAWGQSLGITKPANLTPAWTQTAPVPATCDYEGAVLSARFLAGAPIGLAVPYFAAHVKVNAGLARYVRVAFVTGNLLVLTNEIGTVILTIPGITWSDGVDHEYRVLCDPNADLVTVFMDEALVGTTALSGFSATTTDFTSIFGFTGAGSIDTEWFSFSVMSLRPVALLGQTIGRTFGIWLGGDRDNIDSYAIPRSDFNQTANSALTAVPVPMDWTAPSELRLYLDPTWGACFYRPDLPLPPNAISDAYSTETVNPTDAWISVEYRRLPKKSQGRGELSFGSLDPRSVSQSRWDDVSYRVRARPYGYGIAQTGMTLNRATTFKSGDWNLDKTPEVRLIPAREAQIIFVSDSAIYADRIFMVRVGTAIVPSANWTFDTSTQQIQVLAPILPAGTLVEVTFAPAKPQTKAYQCSRPMGETVTVLNAGTPPVPMSRDGAITRTIVSTPSGDEIQFSYDQSSLYAGVEFCSSETGDDIPLSTICDGPGPGMGLAEIGISGRLTTEPHTVLEGPTGPFKGSPTFRGSAMHFGGLALIAAGGRRALPSNGVLNNAQMYPNARGPDGISPPGGFGMNQDFALSVVDMQTESWDLPGLLNDNVPPSFIDGAVNPNGTPGTMGHGACLIEITDLSGASRLGPWGGLPSLTVGSLLAGGAPLPAAAFTLAGGAPLPRPAPVVQVLQTVN